MGVPGLYRWFVNRYPQVRRRMNSTSRPKIDVFYVDFNCLIYGALAVHNTQDSLASLLEEVCRYLDLLVQSIRPQSVLFIAVDGPAPFAKCAQQRGRRFVSARERIPNTFDLTSISVGTEFMERTHERLLEFFRERTTNDETWKRPQLIYSSHRVPGEGEHKVFEYWRYWKNLGQAFENATHCVYSPDADLIFLGLQTKLKHFYIMKEWTSWIGPHENVGNGKINKMRGSDADFELLHLPLAREYMAKDFQSFNVDNLIDDFATFSFLLGNDFIPHFPDVSVRDGYETIIECYREIVLKQGRFIVENGEFAKDVLAGFLTAVAKAVRSQGSSPGAYLSSKYPDEYKADSVALERKLAFSVLDSFQWVFTYYTQGCPSWTWCFPFFYAPPLSVVAKYVQEYTCDFAKDRPPYPIEQLLCILPPQSAGLLPIPAQAIMQKTSPIAECYPENFKVDLNGRMFEHEGVVLIPLVPIAKVRELVDELVPSLSESEKIRNSWDKDRVFRDGQERFYDPAIHIPRMSHESVPECISTFRKWEVPFDTEFGGGVDVFGNARFDRQSLIVTLDASSSPRKIDSRDEMKRLIGKPILAGWPHTEVSMVVDVVFEDDAPVNSKTSVWKSEMAAMRRNGLDMSSSKAMVMVRPSVWCDRAERHVTFSMLEHAVPYECTAPLTKICPEALRLAPTQGCAAEVGLPVVIVAGADAGKVGVIKSIDGETLTIEVNDVCHENEKIDKLVQKDHENWLKLSVLEGALRIPEKGMMKLLTGIPYGKKMSNQDLAYTAISPGRVLDGCCRWKGRDYQITRDLASSITEYIEAPFVSGLKMTLQNLTDKGKQINGKDLFGKGGKGPIGEILNVVNKGLCKQFFLVDRSSRMLSQATLGAIEQILVRQTEDDDDEEPETVTVRMCDALWRGGVRRSQRTNEGLEIGARVINVANVGPIPFGAAGHIVGILPAESTYDVVLDDEFPLGNTMRKRLRTHRGLIVKTGDLYAVPTQGHLE